MIRWMILSTLAAGVLYAFYLLLFRNDKQLQLRRCYLLVALVFSLIYPLVRLPEAVAPAAVVSVLPEVTVGEVTLAQEAATASERSVAWLPMLYLCGVVTTLAVLAIQFVATAKRLRRGKITLLDDETAPSSFFGHIVIGTRGMSDEELQCVLAHEEEHVRRHHTMDVLLMRLMCCVAWLNPFAWLMLHELRAVHEYQADAAAVGANNKGYLRLLYRQVTGTRYGHITNKFNSINLKNRIIMMNKQKSRFGAWKLAALLPVAALLLLVGCKPAAAPEPETTEPQAQAVEATMDSVYSVVEQEPEFDGGIEAMVKYLSENIQYPEQAKADGIEGRVFVRFVVETDGSVTSAEVLRGIGGGCDEEALRVVQGMPKWKPGMVEGKPVRVNYNLPINFKLH